MACCAAAIFVICQIIYAVRRMLSMLTFGRFAAEPAGAIAANENARWVLGQMQSRTNEPKSSIFTQAKRPTVQLAMAACAIVVLISAQFWTATKPDSGTALAGLGPMADVHNLICGSVSDPRARAVMERDLLLRLSGGTAQIQVQP